MKVTHLLILALGFCAAFGGYLFFQKNKTVLRTAIPVQKKAKPLVVYAFENLSKTEFKKSPVSLGEVLDETDYSYKQLFYFATSSKPGLDPHLKSSGVANIPKSPGVYPVILMFRGFIPEDAYVPGAGTQRVAEVFAQNGFITLAPDFLGFGYSDKPSADSFEARFQTYSTALSLIASLSGFQNAFAASYSGAIKPDISRISIWGHSNGGHIALAVLSITGASYRTVLWAPVAKPFPYSILYYSDEFDDKGKAMRKVLSDFESDYDVKYFSPDTYFSRIKASIMIAQGSGDREVPYWWSEELNETLKKEGQPVTYNLYQGADHNMLPDAWSKAVSDSVVFLRE